jgi:chromosome segregation ATPase
LEELESNSRNSADLETRSMQIKLSHDHLEQEIARQAGEIMRLESVTLQLAKEVDVARQEAKFINQERDGLALQLVDQTIKLQNAEKLVTTQATELTKVRKENDSLSNVVDRRTAEVKDLNNLLKAWEAMRMGKDAQIASLIERGKRSEEDIVEKSRTIEALRRKLAVR